MTKNQLGQYIIPIAVLLVAINSVMFSMFLKTGVAVNNTTIWWIIQAIILGIFFIWKNKFVHKNQIQLMSVVHYYLIWNVFSIVHGLLVAEGYWDWKGLINNSMSLLIPIVAYAATNKLLVQYILKIFVRYGLPVFIGLMLFIFPDAYGYYLAPISFLLLFFPVLNTRWKLFLVALALLVILADLSARSNVIKFSFPLILSFIYYFRNYLSTHIFESVRKLFFLLPILLFILAATDTFNIFHMDDYIDTEFITLSSKAERGVVEQSLKADTRTFIYLEVLYSAEKYDYWWIGRSPARGYESYYFGLDDMSNRGERLGSEVSILNIFTWTGLIGVGLYFCIFYRASYLAIHESNNIFMKILGAFIAFRWLYAWIEDFNIFNITYFFLWVMIGICFSKSFRAMSDKEMITWVNSIFEKPKKKIKQRRIKNKYVR